MQTNFTEQSDGYPVLQFYKGDANSNFANEPFIGHQDYLEKFVGSKGKSSVGGIGFGKGGGTLGGAPLSAYRSSNYPKRFLEYSWLDARDQWDVPYPLGYDPYRFHPFAQGAPRHRTVPRNPFWAYFNPTRFA